MTTDYREVNLREDAESVGHSGVCDRAGCTAPTEYVIAVDDKPACVCGGGCDHGNAALTLCCRKHIGYVLVARREAIEEQLWRDSATCTRIWHVVLDAYPNPVPLAVPAYTTD